MNHLFSKTIIAACILVGSAGAANATGTYGPPATQEASLVFAGADSVTLAIVPTGNLAAGPMADKAKVARANMTSADNRDDTFVLRWTPTGPGKIDTGNAGIAVFKGQNTPEANNIKLMISGSDSANRKMDDGWFLTGDPGITKRKTDYQDILMSGAQKVAADTYIISLQATSWTK